MADKVGCEGVIALLEQIYATLQDYEHQTDTMVNADLETLQKALFARNDLIDALDDLKQRLDDVINLELPEERLLLKTLVKGSFTPTVLDEDHKRIQLLQSNITIQKQRILDKDRVISEQFRNHHTDSRKELEQLKQTKKKIGYYNSAVVGRATGQSLNKNR